MEIQGPYDPNRIREIKRASQRLAGQKAGGGEGEDRLEISEEARILAQLSQISDVRSDRIEALRQQIADGTFETPEKLESAVREFLQRPI